mmetsp:Transcript_12304/g.19872  ORF Transcript_12304/g.19872 Transcript_12304/m.19872 type:complete len:247 (-) Transcript_12304:685-1425(-)
MSRERPLPRPGRVPGVPRAHRAGVGAGHALPQAFHPQAAVGGAHAGTRVRAHRGRRRRGGGLCFGRALPRGRVRIWRRVGAPDDSHNRVRLGRGVQHGVVPATMGAVTGARTAVGGVLGSRVHGVCGDAVPGCNGGGICDLGRRDNGRADADGESVGVPTRAAPALGGVPKQVLQGRRVQVQPLCVQRDPQRGVRVRRHAGAGAGAGANRRRQQQQQQRWQRPQRRQRTRRVIGQRVPAHHRTANQ